MDNYEILEGYNSRLNIGHHDDRAYTDGSQKEVYTFGRDVMKKNNYTTVLDIGCGSGYKLINYLGEFNTIGVEMEPAFSFLNEKYPDRVWLPTEWLGNMICDVAICADVIEHIIDPDRFIKDLLFKIHAKYWIISTPDRDVLTSAPHLKAIYGNSGLGPPVNPCHVREWNFEEFIKFLSRYFNVLESYHSENQPDCQYHLLTIK